MVNRHRFSAIVLLCQMCSPRKVCLSSGDPVEGACHNAPGAAVRDAAAWGSFAHAGHQVSGEVRRAVGKPKQGSQTGKTEKETGNTRKREETKKTHRPLSAGTAHTRDDTSGGFMLTIHAMLLPPRAWAAGEEHGARSITVRSGGRLSRNRFRSQSWKTTARCFPLSFNGRPKADHIRP